MTRSHATPPRPVRRGGLLTTAARAGASKSVFTPVDEDVISALMNFGASRASAEAAVVKARSASESSALKLVR
jgi:hypothetical protein